MERLTMTPGICANASTDLCHQHPDCYTCPHGKKVFQTLHAYEKSGMEPCDYDAMRYAIEDRNTAKEHLSELIKLVGATGADNLRVMAEAYKEGRMAIWPCKVGDTLFWAAHSLNKPIEVLVLSFRDYGHGNRWIHCVTRSFEMSSIGKELFLTREEAEAALQSVITDLHETKSELEET